MSEWKERKLDEVVQFQRGHDLTQSQMVKGPFPVAGSNGIIDYHNKYTTKGPGITLGRSGNSIGVAHFYETDFWAHNTTLYSKNFIDSDPKFVYFLLKTIDFKTFDTGSAVPSLNRNHIHLLDVCVPPHPEQRAIAAVLSSLDDKIDLLNRQNKTLEAMAETMFRQWFVEEEGKLCNIANIVEFNPKRQLSKNTITPYLEMANVSTSTFHPQDWYNREFQSGTKFINGDTLLARITPCLENGKAAFVSFLAPGQVGWGSTEFIVMRSREILHPFFTYVLAKNDEFRCFAEGCLEGSSGRQRVNVDHLENYELYLPCKDRIAQFNEIATSILPKLNNNFRQIKILEKKRDLLLPKLMSGEVRVNV